MLGLVAYDGSSDEEDSNDSSPTRTEDRSKSPSPSEQNRNKSPLLKNEPIEPHISDEEDAVSDNLESLKVSTNTVFHDLPAPTSHSINIPAPVTNIKNKSKAGGVKISIPSLDEFDEEEEESDKPRKTKLAASVKGSGLFSLLPKPRNEFLATPRQLPSKTSLAPAKAKTPTSLVPRQLKNNVPNSTKTSSTLEENISDDEDVDGDFFTIPDKKAETEEVVTEKTIEEYLKPLVPNKSKANLKDTEVSQPVAPPVEDVAGPSNMEMGPHYDNGEIELNNDVLRKLGGRKRKGEELIVREVDGKNLMPDSKEWLTKALSEETNYRPSAKKHEGPTSQQKRKHQITYLAFQAKANELDLKNQWANNRQSKRQTQSKYGF